MEREELEVSSTNFQTISQLIGNSPLNYLYICLAIEKPFEEFKEIQKILIYHYEQLFGFAKQLGNPLLDIRIRFKQNNPFPYNFPNYKCVCIAGTFDHLHIDHKVLLTVAALVTSDKLVIGILSIYLFASKLKNSKAPGSSKKLVEYIEPIQKRKESVREFLRWFKPSLHVEIEEVSRCNSASSCSIVSGMYGKEVEAIVSEDEPESRHGCDAINKLRKEKGLSELPIVLKISNRSISSTQLREWIAKNNKSKL